MSVDGFNIWKKSLNRQELSVLRKQEMKMGKYTVSALLISVGLGVTLCGFLVKNSKSVGVDETFFIVGVVLIALGVGFKKLIGRNA